jgi:hypothetical protein
MTPAEKLIVAAALMRHMTFHKATSRPLTADEKVMGLADALRAGEIMEKILVDPKFDRVGVSIQLIHKLLNECEKELANEPQT